MSRDGRSVAFLWNVGENDVWHAQLRVIGLDGTGERVLVANASREMSYMTPSDWTADGTHVLVTLQRNGGNDIALVDTRTGAVRTVKSMDWRLPTRAALSPDGRWIAYDFPTSVDAPERQLFVLAADGSVEYQLTHAPNNDMTPIWAPETPASPRTSCDTSIFCRTGARSRLPRAEAASPRSGSWTTWSAARGRSADMKMCRLRTQSRRTGSTGATRATACSCMMEQFPTTARGET